jgi:hypothetical protein
MSVMARVTRAWRLDWSIADPSMVTAAFRVG